MSLLPVVSIGSVIPDEWLLGRARFRFTDGAKILRMVQLGKHNRSYFSFFETFDIRAIFGTNFGGTSRGISSYIDGILQPEKVTFRD